MVDDLQNLLILQEKDIRIAELNRQIQAVPRDKAQVELELKTAQDNLEAAKQVYFHVESAIKTIESEVQRHKAKIGDLRGKSSQVRKNDEYRAMMNEIEGHEKKILELEDQELVEWENRDKAKALQLAAQKALEAEKVRVAAKQAEIGLVEVSAKKELDGIQAERDAAAARVPADLLSEYNRTIGLTDKGTFRKGLVPLNHDTCGRCFLKATAAIHQKVIRGEVTRCEQCGALLYDGEE